MIDKGLYKTRVGLKKGSDKDDNRQSYSASQTTSGRSRRSAPSTPRSSPFSGNESRQQYSATQTATGAVKGAGSKRPGSGFSTRFVSGDEGRDSRDAFIRSVQQTNPGYTGGPQRNKPRTLGQFFSGLFSLLPGMGIARGLNNLSQRFLNTDFGRSRNLMDYLDMQKFGGYDEREMARRIRMQEAANLQKRINAGEFGGLDTMLDEVALTTGSLPTNTGGITSLKTGTFEPNTFDDVTATGGGEFPTVMSPGVNYLSPSNFQTIQPFGTVLEDEFPSNRLPSFIEVQDTPQSQDDFFLNAVADAMTFPTDDGSGISLMNRSILRNAGYNDSQIKEAQDAGYLYQLIRDIEGPIGGSLGPSAFG